MYGIDKTIFGKKVGNMLKNNIKLKVFMPFAMPMFLSTIILL